MEQSVHRNGKKLYFMVMQILSKGCGSICTLKEFK